MTMKKPNDKFLLDAKTYEDMRDQLGRSQIENFKFLKGQVADWYIAITAACFAIGGISISLAGDDIKHPALFWWGTTLLIANGVFVFFVRKAELDGEFSGFPDLRQKEADLWTMSKIARERAEGDDSRLDEFRLVSDRFVKDYNHQTKPFRWWNWIAFAVRASMLNIAFGFLLFPVLLLASQLPNHMNVTLAQYSLILWSLLVLYLVYMMVGIYRAIHHKKKDAAANLQIKTEVTRKR
jgi:uncharacterized membrane protein YfcA